MDKPIVRVLVIVALMAAIVVFWLNLGWFGIVPTTQFYLLGGGISLVLLGILYKLLGAWDLIPDWIPVLGAIDDWFAYFVILVGLAGAAVGYLLF